MGKALYRKYRSKNLAEIVGQEHITTTLANALKNGRVSHAYLFTGPRGVGKTSVARILAHEVNGLPYDEEATNLDIIEIDAASNRGIEDIRELRSKVAVTPTSSKYKVYIIDEVHMLTTPAFNALLKTLEEPPAHAIFILATTEAHKLPETIVSRTQRFTFKPIDEKKAVEHLKSIAKSEKIQVSDEALWLIAQHSQGSFRDSIGLLDQVSILQKPIELNDVQILLGIAPAESINKLYETVIGGTAGGVLGQIADFTNRGFSAPNIAKQLSGHIRNLLLEDSLVVERNATVEFLHELLKVPAANDSLGALELALLGFNFKVMIKHHLPAPTKSEEKIEEVRIKSQEKVEAEVPKIQTEKKTPNSDLDKFWPQVLSTIRTKHNTLYSILRMAEASVENDKLRLGFKFAFHQKRLIEAKNQQILSELIKQTLGKPLTIECYVSEKVAPTINGIEPLPTLPEPELESISNIFGEVEVVD